MDLMVGLSLGLVRCLIDGTQAHDAQNCPYCLLVAVSMGALSCHNVPEGAHDIQTERFRPPCECQYCQLQYGNHRSTCGVDLTYTGHVDRETIADLAFIDMMCIRVKIEKMRMMVETHGDLLADRWCRNRRVRKQTLLSVGKMLHPTRSPLLHQMSPTSDLRPEDVHKKVITWLLPYLNVENLVEDGSNLLKLVHHRLNSDPAEWVPFDNLQLYEAWRHGLVPERSAEGCIKMYGKEMGTWQPFNSYEVHRAEAYSAPRALLILAAQASLLDFLEMVMVEILDGPSPANKTDFALLRVRKCMEIINTKLKSAKSSFGAGSAKQAFAGPQRFGENVSLMMAEVLERPSPGNKTDSTVSASNNVSDSAIFGSSKWMEIINAKQETAKSSFGAVFAKQAFAEPPKFDINVLLDIAETQVAEAHDELWLRQTDPEYLVEVSRRFNAQAPYAHPAVKKMGLLEKNEEMNSLANFTTLDPVNRWRDWKCILEGCQAVKHEMDACEQVICLGKPLPSGVERALGCLSAMITKFRQKGRREIGLHFAMSTQFRDWCLYRVGASGHLVWMVGDDKRLFQENPLGWCISKLSDGPEGEPDFDCSLTFQLLDEFLACKSRKESERIDNEMYRHLSDNLALEQMWNLLQYHRPWFPVPDDIDISSESSQSWQFISKLDEVKPLLRTMDQIGAAMSPLRKFRMPQGKRDGEWIARRDAAHRALSDLWKAASDYHGTYLNHAKVPQKYVDTLLELMRLGDSPENQTRLAVEKQTILNHLEAAQECTAAKKSALCPFPPASSSVQQDVQKRNRAEHRDKTKTPMREETTEKTPLCVEQAPPILYRIKTRSKVWKVIHAIFPDPEQSREESDQRVDWTEILSAMATLDLTAVNRGGSAFILSGQIMLPDSPSTQNRSICVYGPHPSTEMSPVLLRSLGKRFHQRFGWQRANFLAIDNPSPLKSCARCRVARYCSRECQKADWSSHRTMCKTLALEKAGSLPPGSDGEESLRPDGQSRCEHCEQ